MKIKLCKAVSLICAISLLMACAGSAVLSEDMEMINNPLPEQPDQPPFCADDSDDGENVSDYETIGEEPASAEEETMEQTGLQDPDPAEDKTEMQENAVTQEEPASGETTEPQACTDSTEEPTAAEIAEAASGKAAEMDEEGKSELPETTADQTQTEPEEEQEEQEQKGDEPTKDSQKQETKDTADEVPAEQQESAADTVPESEETEENETAEQNKTDEENESDQPKPPSDYKAWIISDGEDPVPGNTLILTAEAEIELGNSIVWQMKTDDGAEWKKAWYGKTYPLEITDENANSVIRFQSADGVFSEEFCLTAQIPDTEEQDNTEAEAGEDEKETAEDVRTDEKAFILPENRSVSFTITTDGDLLRLGDVAHFNAELIGYEGLDYTLQWQKSADNENWEDIPEANNKQMDIVRTEENSHLFWRVIVRIHMPQTDESQISETQTSEDPGN